jgi:hypothetical protein
MLVACRLAGLSALETHYADINAQALPLGSLGYREGVGRNSRS